MRQSSSASWMSPWWRAWLVEPPRSWPPIPTSRRSRSASLTARGAEHRSDPAPTMISLQSVTKIYGPVRALVGVTCTFAAGAITVLRGPNGSGKSTLLSIVGTMTRPTSGYIDHGELGRNRQDIRGTLGWVGHESLCYPDLTGRQNIELAATLHDCDGSAAFS